MNKAAAMRPFLCEICTDPMQTTLLSISDFIDQSKKIHPLIVDVRSESEFNKAHFPGAVNIPLLNDEHRKIIGTLYKEKGREEAVVKGFELVGPLFSEKLKTAKDIAENRKIFIYCWRGGMRSNIMSWLFSLAGMKTVVLNGGYKSFRRWCINQNENVYQFLVLDGKTGSGKTEILKMLKDQGEQVIDLEGLSSHRGSTFGNIGLPEQPTQESFENMLAWELSAMNPDKRIWVENESRFIGRVKIPDVLLTQIKNSRFLEIQVDHVVRAGRIIHEYGCMPVDELESATLRLSKRMGGQNVKAAIEQFRQGNLNSWVNILLEYYDKAYDHAKKSYTSPRIITDFNWQDPLNEVERFLAIE